METIPLFLHMLDLAHSCGQDQQEASLSKIMNLYGSFTYLLKYLVVLGSIPGQI